MNIAFNMLGFEFDFVILMTSFTFMNLIFYYTCIYLLIFCSLAGTTDGMYNGKRYMYTPPDLGKFFRLCDVTSVLNVQVSFGRTIEMVVFISFFRSYSP